MTWDECEILSTNFSRILSIFELNASNLIFKLFIPVLISGRIDVSALIPEVSALITLH